MYARGSTTVVNVKTSIATPSSPPEVARVAMPLRIDSLDTSGDLPRRSIGRHLLIALSSLPMVAVSAIALLLVWVAVSVAVVTATGALITMIILK